VVERPGLTEFLQETSQLGELVVFTAGLPEYALPILRAIDPTGAFFGDRIVCRAGTSVSPEYPCVKDLTRLGRLMSRTLIIDDTPLAFLWQPQNGVPILGFRGAADDNLLLDAVLPLLKNADAEADVRPFLDKRFGMEAWFHGHKYQTNAPKRSTKKSPSVSRGHEPAAASAEAREYVRSQVALRWTPSMQNGGKMLLCDFDNTILDFDVPERITEQLAPELVPMLVTATNPKEASTANKVQIMNSVLEEMRQRGVQLPHMREALRRLGHEIPKSMHAVLRSARSHGAVLRMMSNSNDFFISHVLEVCLQPSVAALLLSPAFQFVYATFVLAAA
jgi:carboxy-terminal domain RNA polymerase II polypeptide A small phosphatase